MVKAATLAMCVAGCWVSVSCEEEMRFYFDSNILIEIRNEEMGFCSMIWQLFVASYIQFF